MKKISCTQEIYKDGNYQSTNKFTGIVAMKELTLVVLMRMNNKRDCKLSKRYNRRGNLEITAETRWDDGWEYKYVFGGDSIQSFEQYI